MTDKPRINLFYSYSSKDEKYREELEAHLAILRRQGVIETWSFRKIAPGDDWKSAIDNNLKTAHIILILISADFIASDYCWDVEMKIAMDRHEKGSAVVIPVVLRECDWKSAPFGALQALPTDARPITRWRPRDRGWTTVVEGVRKRVNISRGDQPTALDAVPERAPTARDLASRVADAAARRKAHEEKLSREGHQAFQVEAQKLFDAIAQLVVDISDETPSLRLVGGAMGAECVVRVGKVSMNMLAYPTHPVTDSRLIVTEWFGGILLPTERGKKFYIAKPKERREYKYYFNLSDAGLWCWRTSPTAKTEFTSVDLAERLVTALLEFHEAVESGTLPFPQLAF